MTVERHGLSPNSFRREPLYDEASRRRWGPAYRLAPFEKIGYFGFVLPNWQSIQPVVDF
jgi:hypothetical protein